MQFSLNIVEQILLESDDAGRLGQFSLDIVVEQILIHSFAGRSKGEKQFLHFSRWNNWHRKNQHGENIPLKNTPKNAQKCFGKF